MVPWAQRHFKELVRGCEDEDVWIVPGVGWRLRSVGLTHTTRPGRRRGECLGVFASSAQGAAAYWDKGLRDKRESAWAYVVGRCCHLLGDAAVPARARGVWHFLGDPLEVWAEGHVADLRRIVRQGNGEALEGLASWEGLASLEGQTVEQLIRGLAAAAGKFRADTTRTPWGAVAFRRWGRGVRLEDAEVEAQARVLVPLAVRYTEALLRLGEAKAASLAGK